MSFSVRFRREFREIHWWLIFSVNESLSYRYQFEVNYQQQFIGKPASQFLRAELFSNKQISPVEPIKEQAAHGVIPNRLRQTNQVNPISQPRKTIIQVIVLICGNIYLSFFPYFCDFSWSFASSNFPCISPSFFFNFLRP